MSDTHEQEAERISQESEIEALNIKIDGIKEIISMTNKRIDFFRDMRSDTVALWMIAIALWLIAVTLGICVIKFSIKLDRRNINFEQSIQLQRRAGRLA